MVRAAAVYGARLEPLSWPPLRRAYFLRGEGLVADSRYLVCPNP